MKISIENFKSIEKLELDLAKINILIGPPASGKSNILEALYLYGFPFKIVETYKYDEFENYPDNLFKLIRFGELGDLFYDGEYPVIKINDVIFKLEDSSLKFKIENKIVDLYPFYESDAFKEEIEVVGEKSLLELLEEEIIPTRLYKFDKLPSYISSLYPKNYLAEDFSNLKKIVPILKNDKYYKKLKENFNISIDFETLRLYEIRNDRFLSFVCLSDGLIKFLILLLAIKSNVKFRNQYNKDILILLEEPETHMFPYLISELAEIILEKSNDLAFVITTHNPYFIENILSLAENKNKLGDIKIFIVYRDDEGRTQALERTGKYILEKITSEGVDIFMNYEIL